MYTYHIFFFHSSVTGVPGCFHVLAIVKSVAVHTGVYVSFLYEFSQGICSAAGQAANVENGHVDTAGEEEGEADRESRTDIYILPCVKRVTSGKLLYSTWSSALCSVMT